MRWLTVLFGFVLVTSTSAAQDAPSYADLVGRMLGLERLAVLPQPGERGAMWASNDRRSRYDAENDRYVLWHANGDGNGFIRKEGDGIVMAEIEGPGVIWRIWSAKPTQGHVKTFLDGKLAIDMPFAHYFDAKHAPFDFPTLGYDAARGKNLYIPIPFQESCKVVGEKDWGRYYQFTYATYPKGTKLPAFEPKSAAARAALERVDAFFRDKLGTDPAGKRQGQVEVGRKVSIPAGETKTVASLEGPRAITAITAKMDLPDRQAQVDVLRRLVLRITWDDAKEPAVWCPLGDFFGTAPGVNPYKSLVTGMSAEGFYAYWYMPFAKSAKLELVNDDAAAHTLTIGLAHAPLTRPAETLGRFHAKWHRDLAPLPKDRHPDWTVLNTKGRGRFCGMMLHVWNPIGGQYPPAGDGRWWWGEGDEKFFVDGEKFPSTFGTGTEDYFGYAWCTPALFQRPYHGQTMTEGNRGHQSVFRWQVVDNVPFQASFEGCLEKYFPNERPTLFACTAVWYLAPGGTDPLGLTPAAERTGYYDRPPQAYGGYFIEGQPPGQIQTQPMKNFETNARKWTNHDHLWWTQGKPGARLTILVPVKQAGRHKVAVMLTKAIDYAIVQFHVNGQKAGESVDLYSPDVVPSGPIDLGVHDLAKGNAKLTVEIVGANEKAVKAYMFGLDEVKLEPAP